MRASHRRQVTTPHAVRRWRATAILIAVALAGAGCAAVKDKAHEAENPPAEVQEIAGSELSRITVTEQAAGRLGIRTEPVRAGAGTRLSVPHAAVVYGADGAAWVYTTPQTRVYVRQSIAVERVDGDTAVLTAGPPAGTAIVTTGAAELFGTELGIGK
ncbi:hypothetical protein HII36_04805 [Nonomuraea sp. NN258]|uniref:hypothetical protein n=1 Tax=Nonomuraea antri TaxID=2730852 RepID=UPI00156A1F04|nr:hypothetical protein [Nonomuraea antri]NRQ31154.1 hypothetical protein [Nonomuraea antri]